MSKLTKQCYIISSDLFILSGLLHHSGTGYMARYNILSASVCLVTLRQPSSGLPSKTKTRSPIGRPTGKKRKEQKVCARRIPSGCRAASCSGLTLSGCSPDVSPPVRIGRRWPVRRAAVTSRPRQRRSARLCNAKRVTARPCTAEKSPPFSATSGTFANTGAIIRDRDARSRSLAAMTSRATSGLLHANQIRNSTASLRSIIQSCNYIYMIILMSFNYNK